MSSIINYTISNGEPPFIAELVDSDKQEQIHQQVGTYSFNDVSNGIYRLKITDGNNCVFEKELIVNPSVTTTTTTTLPGDLFVIGNCQDELLIFNENGTNRDNKYTGYPDPNEIDLYLWIKTFNDQPLTTEKILSYNISSDDINDGSTFEIIDYSNEIYSNVMKNNSGPKSSINGDIILKEGFVESFYKYRYKRGSIGDFTIELNSNTNDVYPNLNVTTKNYGITLINQDTIIMSF